MSTRMTGHTMHFNYGKAIQFRDSALCNSKIRNLESLTTDASQVLCESCLKTLAADQAKEAKGIKLFAPTYWAQ